MKGDGWDGSYATYAKVSLVPSTRSMYSFSSRVSIAWDSNY